MERGAENGSASRRPESRQSAPMQSMDFEVSQEVSSGSRGTRNYYEFLGLSLGSEVDIETSQDFPGLPRTSWDFLGRPGKARKRGLSLKMHG